MKQHARIIAVPPFCANLSIPAERMSSDFYYQLFPMIGRRLNARVRESGKNKLLWESPVGSRQGSWHLALLFINLFIIFCLFINVGWIYDLPQLLPWLCTDISLSPCLRTVCGWLSSHHRSQIHILTNLICLKKDSLKGTGAIRVSAESSCRASQSLAAH